MKENHLWDVTDHFITYIHRVHRNIHLDLLLIYGVIWNGDIPNRQYTKWIGDGEGLIIMVFYLSVSYYQMGNIPWKKRWGIAVILISAWKNVHFILVTSSSAAFPDFVGSLPLFLGEICHWRLFR